MTELNNPSAAEGPETSVEGRTSVVGEPETELTSEVIDSQRWLETQMAAEIDQVVRELPEAERAEGKVRVIQLCLVWMQVFLETYPQNPAEIQYKIAQNQEAEDLHHALAAALQKMQSGTQTGAQLTDVVVGNKVPV